MYYFNQFNDKPKSDVNNGSNVKAVVAPKPTKPTRDFIERNKHRAVGQHSAKPGYSDKLVQRRIEEASLLVFKVSTFVCFLHKKLVCECNSISTGTDERVGTRYDSTEEESSFR